MKKNLTAVLTIVFLFLSLAGPIYAAVGDDIIGPINLPSDIPGRGITNSTQAENKINDFVRGGIRIVFLIGLVGVLFFFSIGGIRWVFSAGDKQKIDQAKGMITAAIVGFAILALSYIILVLIGTFFGIKIVQEPPETCKAASSCVHLCTPPGTLDNGDSCTDANANAYCKNKYGSPCKTEYRMGGAKVCCP